MKLKIISIAVVVIVVVSVGVGVSLFLIKPEEAPIETVTLEFGDAPWVCHLPIHIAQVKGFAAEEGLDIRFSVYSMPAMAMDDVLTGRLHGVTDGASWAIMVRLGKGDIALLSNLYDYGPATIGFVAKDGIETGADLRGKKIATIRGTIWDYTTYKLLDKYGMTEEDVQIESFLSAIEYFAAMERGEIDGAWFWEFLYDKARVELEGYHTLITGYDLDPMLIESWGIIPVQEAWARENPEVLKRLLRATQEGIDWINANEWEAAKIVEEEYMIPAPDAYRSIRQIEFYLGLYDEYVNFIKEMKDWAVEKGYIDDYDFEAKIISEPLKEVFPEKVTWKP